MGMTDKYECDNGHTTEQNTRVLGVPLLAIDCPECDKKAFKR